MIRITNSITLADDEIEEQFIRSSGPGGQNVNKVETAVQLRFDAAHSPAISPDVLGRLTKLAGWRMTQDGVIIISADRYRSQARNRVDAMERLVNLIRKAATPPKRRRPTKPTKGSKERRIQAKKQRGNIKKLRSVGPE